MILFDSAIVIMAYLLGSFSSAVVICRLMKLPDPRTLGSGNPGATNVLRHGGKKAAILTLLFDTLKGVIAVLLVKLLTDNVYIIALVTLAVFLGHLYPVFFGFRGGKGVATALGALLALIWPVGLMALATWLLVAFGLGYSSLAALTAAILTPVYVFLFSEVWQYVLMSGIMSLLLIWRHRSNIRNLITGKETKIGRK
jgi:acyl phosphate:glycerol-3-phosphate acyltransferase